MQPQVLGHPKSRTTRKAQRYFSERGVLVTYNDLRKRPPTPGELRKWVERFGVDGVLDRNSAAYREAGLAYLSAGVDTWLEQFAERPLLLRLPLVRCGRDLSVGDDPAAWQRFVELAKARGARVSAGVSTATTWRRCLHIRREPGRLEPRSGSRALQERRIVIEKNQQMCPLVTPEMSTEPRSPR